MHIYIESIQGDDPLHPVTFTIDLEGLKNAIENCYLALGTLYDPIKIDNFVNVENNGFSFITEDTTVLISLQDEDKDIKTDNDNSLKICGHRLICCKLNIVDKAFIDKGMIADKAHWEKIFKFKKKLMYSAPDGTLYVSPKNKKCVIRTTKSVEDYNVSYSILIALDIEFINEKSRPFYFILDPLVKISSGDDKNPPVNN